MVEPRLPNILQITQPRQHGLRGRRRTCNCMHRGRQRPRYRVIHTLARRRIPKPRETSYASPHILRRLQAPEKAAMTAGIQHTLPSAASVDLAEANFGQVRNSEKTHLMHLLEKYRDLFPCDPKNVPPCTLGNYLCLSMMKGVTR